MSSKIQLNCQQCEKGFEHLNPKKKFCSNECRYLSLSNRFKQPNASCKNCSTEFKKSPSDKKIFCSRTCRNESLSKSKEIHQCIGCKKEFLTYKSNKRKYCSKNCFISYNKSAVIKNCLQCNKKFQIPPSAYKYNRGKYCSEQCSQESKKKKIIKICENCNKQFECIPSQLNRKYCSKECNLECVYHYKDGILYLISMTDFNGEKFTKIGITTKSIEKRWSGFDYNIIENIKLPIGIAWKIEQYILSTYNENRYIPKMLISNGSSECYSIFDRETILDYVKKYRSEYLSDKEINSFYDNFFKSSKTHS